MQLISRCSVILSFNEILTSDYFELLTNEVIPGNGEVSASNAGSGMARGFRCSPGKLMRPMHSGKEQISDLLTGVNFGLVHPMDCQSPLG
jgi:hypothetical protein